MNIDKYQKLISHLNQFRYQLDTHRHGSIQYRDSKTLAHLIDWYEKPTTQAQEIPEDLQEAYDYAQAIFGIESNQLDEFDSKADTIREERRPLPRHIDKYQISEEQNPKVKTTFDSHRTDTQYTMADGIRPQYPDIEDYTGQGNLKQWSLRAMRKVRCESNYLPDAATTFNYLMMKMDGEAMELMSEYERPRRLYERLLEKTEHVKVWISYAHFEINVPDAADQPSSENESAPISDAAKSR